MVLDIQVSINLPLPNTSTSIEIAKKIIENYPDEKLLSKIGSSLIALNTILEQGKTNWVVTFSGGKDSSTVLFLILEAVRKKAFPSELLPEKITVLYNDTLLEFPPLHENALTILEKINEMHEEGIFDIPVEVIITEPDERETFWTYVIGRGYPPPHQKFRWCVDRLKIRPSNRVLKKMVNSKTVIITGIRFGESKTRDRNLKRLCARGGECGQGIFYTFKNKLELSYLAPIAHWAECEVWDFLNFIAPSFGWDPNLASIYNGDNTRFGCWACTVIKKDKTMEKVVNTPGGEKYKPLLEFRDWLKEIGDNQLHPEYRVKRPNGKSGRLKTEIRQEILRKLLETQEKTGLSLISDKEKAICEGLLKSGFFGDSYKKY